MSDFMMRAEIEGLVCSGIDRMNERTYALLDERVPPAKALHREEALATLATNYFRSHSPAGLPDFAWWSGLSAGDAKQAVNLIRPELSDEVFGDTHLFVHRSCKSSAGSIYGFHLLPSFDEYIIAYRDRTGVLAAEHQPAVFTKNGIFRPAIVENGRVAGVWKKTADGDGIGIQTSFFDENGRIEAAAVNRYKMFYTNKE
jgi:hypothetical protein